MVKEVAFLGVILDENLIFHIKISKSIGIIYKSSFCLSKSSLHTLYYALVYPYLQYCISVWGFTYSTNLNRVILLQKRAVRIVDKEAFDAHTDPIFKELKILKFDKLYLFNLGKFMYSYYNNLLTRSFDNTFLRKTDIHNYYTRNFDLYYVSYTRNFDLYKYSVIYS